MERMIGENDELPVILPENYHTSNHNKRPSSYPPSVEMISSDDSSLDDSMGSRSCGSSSSTCCKKSCFNKKKRVSWDQIHTREYALVVGDHPMCRDGLPVSLGWAHMDCDSMTMLKQQHQQQPLSRPIIPERRQSYTFPKRLTYEERQERLLQVSNLTLDQIKNDEIDLVIRTLRESWDMDGEGLFSDILSTAPNSTDPLADMMALDDDDILLLGMALEDGAEELGDITNFEWTDDAPESWSNNNQGQYR